MRPLFISVVILFTGLLPVHAQDNQNAFPDTITPSPADYFFTTRADTFKGDTLFTIQKGRYVLETHTNLFNSVVYVFVKTKKGYNVFNACPDVDGESFTCDTMNFDEKGNPELIVHWSWYWGHGGFRGSVHSDYEGLFIWNLDQLQLVYSIQNVYYDEVYSIEYAVDSLGEENIDSIVGEGHTLECSSWNCSYEPKTIILTWDDNCQPTDENGNALSGPGRTTYAYSLTPSGLVLQPEGTMPQKEITLPDSFPIYKLVSEWIPTLDSAHLVIFDSISNPKAYFGTTATYYSNVYLLVQRKTGFDKVSLNCSDDGFTFRRVDFNGKGNQEIVIETKDYAGHSGWENSIHEHWGYTIIIDPDSLNVLFSLENYYSLMSWWQEFADTLDSIPYEERRLVNSGSQYDCESYAVEISLNKITIRETANCPDQDDNNNYKVSDPTVYEYRLTKKGLVRDRDSRMNIFKPH